MAFGLFKKQNPDPTIVLEFRIGDTVHSIGTYADFSRPKSNRKVHQHPDQCWVATGSSVVVAGRTLPGPLYVGQSLGPVAAENYWVDIEPALIDPSLPVSSVGTKSDAPEDHWRATYEGLTPDQRAVYLDWLASGRRAWAVDRFYVEMFLWGIERRMLSDAQQNPAAAHELPAIVNELERIRDDAGEDRSLELQTDRLIQVLRVRELEQLGSGIAPPTERINWETPLELRIGLGALAGEDKPMSAAWALSWLRTNPNVYLRTPADRCADEFNQLFAIRFGERHPNGIRIRPMKTKIKLNYHAMSPGFDGGINFESRFSEVVNSAQLANPLNSLIDDCTSSLDALSRLLGRQPRAIGTIDAIELLPPELLSGINDGIVSKFRELAHRVADTHATCSVAELFSAAGNDFIGKLKKSDFVTPSRMLEKFDVGFEPDPRFDAHIPDAGDELVLFRIPRDKVNTPTDELLLAAAYLHLAASVAGADGTIDDVEFDRLKDSIGHFGVTAESEVARLMARLETYRNRAPAVKQLKARANKLQSGDRKAVLESIVGIAFSDGTVSPEEVKALTAIYDAFGVSSKELFGRLHAVESANAKVSSSPIGDAGQEDPVAAPSEFGLDKDAIERKARDTERATAILEQIFSDDEGPRASPKRQSSGRFGLDANSTKFMEALVGKPGWTRSELGVLAAECEVLLDGALEAINEAAYEAVDAPLWEGDDPVDVYVDTMEEMEK